MAPCSNVRFTYRGHTPVPVTLRFVNDIETSVESDKPATWPDRNPDATEARRRGWIL